MARTCRAPVVFVGTAKSVYVAPYGPMEERLLRSARGVFVRDRETQERLVAHGVAAQSPGNAIVDLYARDAGAAIRAGGIATGYDPLLALLPGSRANAYSDARFLASIVRQLSAERPGLGAMLSIAPNLDLERFAGEFRNDGWEVRREDGESFALYLKGRGLVTAWTGAVGALFARASLVLGQAGTANEAAAAAGIPIVAFEIGDERKGGWYRRRQKALLGDALAVLPGDPATALAGVSALLEDASRRAHMGRVGKQRMGPAGGSLAIAQHIVASARAA